MKKKDYLLLNRYKDTELVPWQVEELKHAYGAIIEASFHPAGICSICVAASCACCTCGSSFILQKLHHADGTFALKHRSFSPPMIASAEAVIDFEFCSADALKDVLSVLNQNRYRLAGVTQNVAGDYTVFFWRPANG